MADVRRLHGEPVYLDVTRTLTPPDASPDTATVRISASWHAQPDAIVVGENVPSFAGGSLTKRIVLAPLGKPPVHDTVRLVLNPWDSTSP